MRCVLDVYSKLEMAVDSSVLPLGLDFFPLTMFVMVPCPSLSTLLLANYIPSLQS